MENVDIIEEVDFIIKIIENLGDNVDENIDINVDEKVEIICVVYIINIEDILKIQIRY